MIAVSKKLLLMFLLVPSIVFSHSPHKTKKLDIVITPADEQVYIFALNAGEGISTDPLEVRPVGSTVTQQASVFPGGKIKKKSNDFAQGVNCKKRIGVVSFVEDMLAEVQFDPANPMFPEEGTVVAMSNWQIRFNRDCHNEENMIFLTGFSKMKQPPAPCPGSPVMTLELVVIGGAGCNPTIDNNFVKGRVYVDEMGATLIKLEFAEEIEYRD